MKVSSQRVWLVTGSSSGFGLAMCKLALARGDKVVAALRQPSDIDDLAAAHPPTALLVQRVDVTRPADVAAAFRAAKEHFGRVDVVFNNAACTMVGELEGTPDSAARSLMEVNFWGATTVSKEAVRFFRDDNPPGAGGLLLNNSSEFGHCPGPCASYYTAAKHALEGVTESLSCELDPKWNIKICLVTPGFFRTELKAKGTMLAVHPAYASVERINATRNSIEKKWDESRTVRIGDAQKAAERIHAVSLLPNPPRRLFLGMDCVELVRSQLEGVLKELKESEEKWAGGLVED